jgi:regulator of sigma E protease
VSVVRAGQKYDFIVVPKAGMNAAGQQYGMMGVVCSVDETLLKSWVYQKQYGFLESLWAGIEKMWDVCARILASIGGMISGDTPLKQIGGPVSIAHYAGVTAQAGLQSFLTYMALISISLGIMNLLPVPMLDGGRLLYHAAEWIRGKPLPQVAYEWGYRVSVTFIVLLMGIALFNDFSAL